VLGEVLSSVDLAANAAPPAGAGGENLCVERAGGSGCADGGGGAGGQKGHSLLGHLVETLHAVAYGSHAPEGGGARQKASHQSPSGIQWDMAHVTRLLALAARCTPPASACPGGCACCWCKGLTAGQQAMLARLLVREGLWATLLRQCARDADARGASLAFRGALLAWLAHMHPSAHGPQSETHSSWGASEAEEVAPMVWEEGQALAKCVKTGWKMAGIGAQEAQQTLAATFHIYLTMPARPAAALALVLLDCPADVVCRGAQDVAGVAVSDEALGAALSRLLALPLTRSLSRWVAHMLMALYLASRPLVVAAAMRGAEDEFLRELCRRERGGNAVLVLQPVLLGDGASSHVVGPLLSRIASIVRASSVARGLMPAPRVTAADCHAPTAPPAHAPPPSVQEPQACGEAKVKSTIHADAPPENLESFGLAVKGVDLPTRIAPNTTLRATVSLERTCEFAPTRVALILTGTAPSHGVCGTMSGAWMNHKHEGVAGVAHATEEGLVIFAVHEDGHTKMAAWRRPPGSSFDAMQHGEARAHVGSLQSIDAASLSRTWDSASDAIPHAAYTVSDIKVAQGERRHARSSTVHLGAVGHQVALSCVVDSGLPEAGAAEQRGKRERVVSRGWPRGGKVRDRVRGWPRVAEGETGCAGGRGCSLRCSACMPLRMHACVVVFGASTHVPMAKHAGIRAR